MMNTLELFSTFSTVNALTGPPIRYFDHGLASWCCQLLIITKSYDKIGIIFDMPSPEIIMIMGWVKAHEYTWWGFNWCTVDGRSLNHT